MSFQMLVHFTHLQGNQDSKIHDLLQILTQSNIIKKRINMQQENKLQTQNLLISRFIMYLKMQQSTAKWTSFILISINSINLQKLFSWTTQNLIIVAFLYLLLKICLLNLMLVKFSSKDKRLSIIFQKEWNLQILLFFENLCLVRSHLDVHHQQFQIQAIVFLTVVLSRMGTVFSIRL